MEWKESYIDGLMRARKGSDKERVQARMKRQWSARCYLRFAIAYFPEGHPLRLRLADDDAALHLRPGISESDIARERQRNLELADEVEKAGSETEVRPAFWRQLVQSAAAMQDRTRAERYEKRFHEALKERVGKRPPDEE